MKPKVTLITGMHRSGTSMLTRMLNICGMYLGKEEHMMSPGGDNPKGFWENLIPVRINDNILKRGGGSWNNPPHFIEGWDHDPYLNGLYKKAAMFINDIPPDKEWWGFKDPRSCFTLPFWKRILDNPDIIICLRNPIDVAKSLNKRNKNISTEQGMDLWYRYNKEIYENTNHNERIVISFDEMIKEPDGIFEALGFQLFKNEDFSMVDVFEDLFDEAVMSIDRGLIHHETNLRLFDEMINTDIEKLYRKLYLESFKAC